MKTGTAWCMFSWYVEFECLGMRLYIAAFSTEIDSDEGCCFCNRIVWLGLQWELVYNGTMNVITALQTKWCTGVFPRANQVVHKCFPWG